jgi:hypothetical protein
MRKHQLNLPGIGRPLNLSSLPRLALRDRQARENELAVYSKLAENTQFSVPNLMIVMKLRSDAERSNSYVYLSGPLRGTAASIGPRASGQVCLDAPKVAYWCN